MDDDAEDKFIRRLTNTANMASGKYTPEQISAANKGATQTMEILDAEETLDHLERAIKGFVTDPADTDYQRGYLAALCELHRVVAGTRTHWVAAIEEKNKLHKVTQ